MSAPWIVLGGGGHAGVVVDVLRLNKNRIIGYTAPDDGASLGDQVPWLGDDDVLLNNDNSVVRLANGLGSTRDTSGRANLFQTWRSRGFCFPPVIHPRSVIAHSVAPAPGIQVMAGAIIQPNSSFGENVLINTKASVGHDCHIQRDVHIASGATLAGGVFVGCGVHVGVGATVVQSVAIGDGSTIGAGAVVTRDVSPGVLVLGIPGREVDLGDRR